jgi:ABC-2 type transport system permease protein
MSATPESSTSTASLARRAGFMSDLLAVAGRALRTITREPESVIPALIVPVFFYVVNTGSLTSITTQMEAPGFSFKAFQLPVAIVFAVTGVSRASTLVTDIQDGYFDRLTLTPIRRPTLLLGLMVADLVLVIALSVPLILLAMVLGVRFATGPLGIVAFIGLGAAWGLAFTGIPYAIALRTGSAAAVNSTFLLFFPFAFLTTAFVPEQFLSGWLATVATYNPVTYLLAAMRTLAMEGWDWAPLVKGVLVIACVAIASFGLALAAFRGRMRAGG